MRQIYEPNRRRIGRSLKEIGLTIRKVADETGYSKSHVERILRGEAGASKAAVAKVHAIIAKARKLRKSALKIPSRRTEFRL